MKSIREITMATIKNIILFALTAVMMVGCHFSQKDNEMAYNSRYQTVIIDSCEYLGFDGTNFDLTHKGNCKYCQERRQKELKELIRQLKEEGGSNEIR